MLYHFISFSYCFPFMIENNLRNEPNLVKLIDRAMSLFREMDLTELAEKWEKILKNYNRQKMVR